MDLAIMNGRAFADKGRGATTFCGVRGESSIDHLICNKNIMKNLTDFKISDHLEFSDHKSLLFKLKVNISKNNVGINTSQKRPKWREDYKNNFTDFLIGKEVEENVYKITEELTSNNNEINLHSAVNFLEKTFRDAGHCHQSNPNYKPNQDYGAKWFDKSCFEQKQKFVKVRDIFRNDKCDENREKMCFERNNYRKICRKTRSNFKKKEAERLLSLSKNDSKKFWREM